MEKKNGRTSLENEDEMASDVKKSQNDIKIDAKDSVVFSTVTNHNCNLKRNESL